MTRTLFIGFLRTENLFLVLLWPANLFSRTRSSFTGLLELKDFLLIVYDQMTSFRFSTSRRHSEIFTGPEDLLQIL